MSFSLAVSSSLPCPGGTQRTSRVSPGSNPLTLQAKYSNEVWGVGVCEEKVLSFIHTYRLSVQMESSKGVTLGQLVREATHATAQ